MVSFAELIELPVFERREDRRKKVFKSFWMTSDENFEIIKRIEQETAKKRSCWKGKRKYLKKSSSESKKNKSSTEKKTKGKYG